MQMTVEDVRWPAVQFNESEERADGLHLGTVIKFIQNRSGMGYSGKGFSDMELTAEIGVLWENVFSKVMAEKYAGVRPPQICEDGIWMSLDGIGPDPNDEVPIVVDEMKCTWKSTKSTPDENFYYMTQVKSYCRAIGTNVAMMYVFHIMGDYKGSGPIYRVARLVFDPIELQQNWEMVLKFRDVMEEENESKA